MKIIQSGSQYRLADVTSTGDCLEPGNYLLCVDQAGFYLTKKEDFILPKKIYGDHHEIDRWLESYEQVKKKIGHSPTIKEAAKTTWLKKDVL